jgi:hypothetical protein
VDKVLQIEDGRLYSVDHCLRMLASAKCQQQNTADLVSIPSPPTKCVYANPMKTRFFGLQTPISVGMFEVFLSVAALQPTNAYQYLNVVKSCERSAQSVNNSRQSGEIRVRTVSLLAWGLQT